MDLCPSLIYLSQADFGLHSSKADETAEPFEAFWEVQMVKLGTSIGGRRAIAATDWTTIADDAKLLEDLGFDFTTVGQHSFTPEFPSPAPLTRMAWLAGKTERLNLLTGVVILPLYPPASIAEQVAEISVLSGGRIMLGAGVGYRQYEFDGYQIDMKTRGRRMDEAVQLLHQVFQTGEFEFHGKFYPMPKLPLAPRPASPPPIFVGGTSEPALNRAARWGDGLLTENMSTLEVMSGYLGRYRQLTRGAGRQPGSVVLYRNAYLSTSRKEIEEDFIPAVLKEHLGYRSHGAAENVDDEDTFYARAAKGETIGLEELDGRMLAGDPEQMIRQIKTWEKAIGMTHINLMGVGPETSPEARRKTLELWGKEVIPYV
ncbi:MAG: LLM class flavin-dependent oxidoreductase [Caulobacteraceae bacterium]|nr:LLM class flavin-dependent oxidoreductase [Caulobacteraceae bacterium]